MKKILIAFLVIHFNVSFAQTVDLVCKGKENNYSVQKSNSEYKNLFTKEEDLEISFDDKKNSMSLTGVYLCNFVNETIINENLKIDSKALEYSCTSKRNDYKKNEGIHTNHVGFSLSRFTGKLKLNGYASADEVTFYREGIYNCEKAKTKF